MAESHDLTKILDGVTRNSCPNDINFHCHTLCSDGSLHPLDLLNQASSLGIRNLAITDHHSLTATKMIIDKLTKEPDYMEKKVNFWTGIEISCLLDRCLVHMLGLGFDASHPSLKPYITGDSPTGSQLNAVNVINSIHEAKGLAILAHPARYRIPYRQLINSAAELDVDGAEVWYDYEFNERWRPTDVVCDEIDSQVKQLGLLASCGTDTHGYNLNGR